MIGVVVMNYHGYLILQGGPIGKSNINRFFDPFTGPLATRFAATFVLVAGNGHHPDDQPRPPHRRSGSPQRRPMDADPPRLPAVCIRVRLRMDLERHDPVLLRRDVHGRRPAVPAANPMVGGGRRSRQQWLRRASSGGRSRPSTARPGCSSGWYAPGQYRSPRRLVFDTFVNGTHPLLPWLAFLCAGMILGSYLPLSDTNRRALGDRRHRAGRRDVLGPVAVRRLSPAHSHVRHRPVQSQPQLHAVRTRVGGRRVLRDRLDRHSNPLAPLSRRALAAAGRTSLSLYVAARDRLQRGRQPLAPDPPGRARRRARCSPVAIWLVAIVAAAWWQRRFGIGPAEWVYRKFGGGGAPIVASAEEPHSTSLKVSH